MRISRMVRDRRGRMRTESGEPALGEHNAEVYGALGIDAAELEELKRAGVV